MNLVAASPRNSLSSSTSPASEMVQYGSATGRDECVAVSAGVSCGCELCLSQQKRAVC